MQKYVTRLTQDWGSKTDFGNFRPSREYQATFQHSEFWRAIYHTTEASTTDDIYRHSDHTEMALAMTNVPKCSTFPDRQ